jgi:hypothetical protein
MNPSKRTVKRFSEGTRIGSLSSDSAGVVDNESVIEAYGVEAVLVVSKSDSHTYICVGAFSPWLRLRRGRVWYLSLILCFRTYGIIGSA